MVSQSDIKRINDHIVKLQKIEENLDLSWEKKIKILEKILPNIKKVFAGDRFIGKPKNKIKNYQHQLILHIEKELILLGTFEKDLQFLKNHKEDLIQNIKKIGNTELNKSFKEIYTNFLHSLPLHNTIHNLYQTLLHQKKYYQLKVDNNLQGFVEWLIKQNLLREELKKIVDPLSSATEQFAEQLKNPKIKSIKFNRLIPYGKVASILVACFSALTIYASSLQALTIDQQKKLVSVPKNQYEQIIKIEGIMPNLKHILSNSAAFDEHGMFALLGYKYISKVSGFIVDTSEQQNQIVNKYFLNVFQSLRPFLLSGDYDHALQMITTESKLMKSKRQSKFDYDGIGVMGGNAFDDVIEVLDDWEKKIEKKAKDLKTLDEIAKAVLNLKDVESKRLKDENITQDDIKEYESILLKPIETQMKLLNQFGGTTKLIGNQLSRSKMLVAYLKDLGKFEDINFNHFHNKEIEARDMLVNLKEEVEKTLEYYKKRIEFQEKEKKLFKIRSEIVSFQSSYLPIDSQKDLDMLKVIFQRDVVEPFDSIGIKNSIFGKGTNEILKWAKSGYGEVYFKNVINLENFVRLEMNKVLKILNTKISVKKTKKEIVKANSNLDTMSSYLDSIKIRLSKYHIMPDSGQKRYELGQIGKDFKKNVLDPFDDEYVLTKGLGEASTTAKSLFNKAKGLFSKDVPSNKKLLTKEDKLRKEIQVIKQQIELAWRAYKK